MADNFPTIAEPAEISEEYIKHQIISEMESGCTISRAGATIGKWRWELSWDSLPRDDFIDLQEHFGDNVGSSFSWTHPLDSTTYTVRYLNQSTPKAVPVGWIDGAPCYALSGLILEQA